MGNRFVELDPSPHFHQGYQVVIDYEVVTVEHQDCCRRFGKDCQPCEHTEIIRQNLPLLKIFIDQDIDDEGCILNYSLLKNFYLPDYESGCSRKYSIRNASVQKIKKREINLDD
jgi:hypothetical protein